MNILDRANKIVNERSEEQSRQYGDFDDCMIAMRDIFNAMTGLELEAHHMYKAMIALKFAREKHTHKEDNLLDAAAYIGALNNFEEKYTRMPPLPEPPAYRYIGPKNKCIEEGEVFKADTIAKSVQANPKNWEPVWEF